MCLLGIKLHVVIVGNLAHFIVIYGIKKGFKACRQLYIHGSIQNTVNWKIFVVKKFSDSMTSAKIKLCTLLTIMLYRVVCPKII